MCLADPVIRSRLAELGGEAQATSPAEFARFAAAETEKWSQVIRAAGLKAD